ncbi:alpha/beta fold hydrolase [Gordonia sp. DT219]|uniref:alpha/beta fold hydrolase n=1 Tax=Gordonia sp. DT219 TaxID=3416658 RepID=UPI003CFA0F97
MTEPAGPRSGTSVPGRFVEVDGRRIHVVDEGAGPPVLLMAALGSNWFDLDPLAARLVARGHRVVRYDRPGYGMSEAPRAHHVPSLDGEIDRMLAVLDAVGVAGSVILVGHSLASLYVEGFARTRPDRTAGVLILDGSYVLVPWRILPTGVRVGNAHRAIGLLRTIGRCSGIRPADGAAVRERVLPRPPEGFDESQRRWAGRLFGGPSMLLATLTENAAFPAINAALRRMRHTRPMPEVPTIVLAAVSGPAVWQRYWCWKQRRYAADLGAQFRTVAARHFVVLDRPDEVAELVGEVGGRT